MTDNVVMPDQIGHLLFHWFKVSIRSVRVEELIGPHEGDERLGVGEVDDVVGVAGEHVDGLDFVAGDLEVQDLVGVDAALLDEGAAGDHDEELPFGVMPMLPLRDAGVGNIDRKLAVAEGLDKFREGAARIDIGLQREGDLFLGQIAQERAIQLLGEAPGRNLRHDQRLPLLLELVQQVHNLPERRPMRRGHITVLAVLDREDAETVEVTAVLLPLQASDHLVHEVVDVQEFELDRRVIDLVLEVIGNGVAEGGDGGIVIRPAPFAEEVREAVDQHLHAVFLPILQEQVLPRLLASAVLGIPEPARQRRLLAAGQHHRAGVLVLTEGIQECRCKPEIPAHELLHILRPIHPRQVEHKVRLRAPLIELSGGRVEVVFIYVRDGYAVVASFSVADVFKLCAEVLAYETLGTGDKYLHYSLGYSSSRQMLCFCVRLIRL